MKTLKDILNDFIAKFADDNEFYSVRCRVESVNLELYTCNVETIQDNNIVEDVQIGSNIGAKFGILIVPVVGSTVIVSFNSKNDAYISKTGEIDKFLFLFDGGTTIEIDSGEIILNGGDYGGLIQIQKLTDRLNDLVNEVRNLKTVLDTHTHIGVTTGVGTSGTPTPFIATFTDFNKTDYENEIIKHGSI